jgi:hypothetical protein
MALTFKNSQTGEQKVVGFPWHWIITPLCALDLFAKGMFMYALVGWIPLFTIIFSIQWKSILTKAMTKKGYELVP